MSDAATLQDSPANPNPAPTPPADPAPAPVPPTDQIPPADPAPAPNDPPADPTPPGTWPEDWREQYAKDDEKTLKRLQRYASPQAALDAMIAAQDKIRSGVLKSALPENATPDQLKQWREENGIPESPDKYDVGLPDGLSINEHDKALVDGFLNSAHAANMDPKQVKQTMAWYFTEQQKQIDAVAEADAQSKRAAEDELRGEWGGEYRQNINLINGMMDTAPAGVRENFMGARLADGSILENNPQVLRYLIGLAREINPVATVVPGAGVNTASAIDNEIAALEGRMRNDRTAYFKDNKAQARYRELITARDRFKR